MAVEDWKSLFDIATVILLGLTFVAGAGVLITGNIINRAQETKLRKFDSDLTTAKSDLALQEARAAALEVEAAEASKGVAGLQKLASDAKSAQQQVELDLAKQKEKTATAEAALFELQERIQSRHLSAKQKADIKAGLERFPPQNVGVQVFVGTPDGIPFCLELMEAINSSGWHATDKGQSALGGQIRGVVLLMKDNKHPPMGAIPLQDALKAAGIDALGVSDPILTDSELIVFVAPKNI